MTASFPNSVKDFTDKEDGKKIYAAHINELQDEVEAIETTLLAGTEGQVLTAGSGGVPEWAAASGGGLSYKVYTAILTQSGKNVPTAEVIENTFADTPTFEYLDPGIFQIHSTEFVDGMTCFGIITHFTVSDFSDEFPRTIMLNINSPDGEVLIISQDPTTWEFANDFVNVNLEIRIYD